MEKNEKLYNIRHTLSHLLAASVRTLYPDAKNTIGPAIEDGFYEDFELANPISDKNLPQIEKKMRELLKTWSVFERREVTKEEAKKEFAWNPYKTELIEEFAKDGKNLTFYINGGFVDLCKGGHMENAEEIVSGSFKLDRVAGAYWRGDEKNKMLTRIYGLAFETKEALDEYIKQREEAEKRDHKKLGKELDLFTFSELVGAGLPLWTPKGTILRNSLDNFVWELRKAVGYEQVDIPHVTKKELYETSKHWDKFKDELFKIKTREGHLLAMKPMNCPHHTQIYDRKQWSYRELPQRYANTTKVYRDEQSGELMGVARVISITQDDAHVFCRITQTKDEIKKIWDIVHTFYGAFGLKLNLRLSSRDLLHPEKYSGNKDLWEKAEKVLREIAKENNTEYVEAKGEAAFYAPKLDFMATDSMGRKHQVATIQLDVSMPDSFDLTCINEKGEKERIVMIHAAIMGSIERFLAVLIEHYAGAFPLWLSPVQVKVIPVRTNHNEYAKQVFELLKENNIRAELDDKDENLGTKVRDAKTNKIPYWIVVGDKEVEADKVTLESRDSGQLGQMSKEELVKKLLEEIKNKK